MAGYSTFSDGSSISIKANTYEIRLTSVTMYSDSSNGSFITFNRYDSGSLSGGTSIGITALRDGAPAASATAKTGASVSGSLQSLWGIFLASGSADSLGFTSPGTTNQESPLPITIAPGSVFNINVQTNISGLAFINVFFEELRLQGSY